MSTRGSRKLEAGEVDALVLALCGLERLGKADRASEILSLEMMLPAVGQGALAIECRADDETCAAAGRPLHDAASAACVTAERAMLAALDGSCRTPIAGLAEIDGERLTLEGCCCRRTAAPRSAGGARAASATPTRSGPSSAGSCGAAPDPSSGSTI